MILLVVVTLLVYIHQEDLYVVITVMVFRKICML